MKVTARRNKRATAAAAEKRTEFCRVNAPPVLDYRTTDWGRIAQFSQKGRSR